MNNLKLLFCAASVAVTATLAGCSGESPDEMLASAKAFLAKRDLPAATIQLKNALAKNPNLAEGRLLLGQTLLENGDVNAAEVELRKARDLKAPAEQVSALLAKAMLLQGKAKDVIAEFSTTSLSLPEQNADLKTTVGQAYAVSGDFDLARKSFEAALTAKNDFAPALLASARLKASESDIDGAMNVIDGLLLKSPERFEAWLLKGDLQRILRKNPEAIAAYEKALEIRPGLLNARASLASIHLREQKFDDAKMQVEAMEKQAPSSSLTLYMRGLYAFSTKDLTGARTAMEALLRIQPKNARALQLAGLVAFAAKSDVQAQEFLLKALQNAPSLEFGRRALAMSYLRTGQSSKAMDTLKPALQAASPDPIWLKLAGDAHMQSGNAKEAEDQYRAAAAADPKNQQFKTALAMARLRSGNAEQALADLEQIASVDTAGTADVALVSSHMARKRYDKALSAIAALEKKQPANLAVHNMRGAALIAKGDKAGARASLERALAIDPAYYPAAAALAQLDISEKHPEDARRRFESLLVKDPKNANAHLAIAEIAARSGDKPGNVARIIEQAIKAAPENSAPRIALANLYLGIKEPRKALSVIQDAMAAQPDRPELLNVAGKVFQINGDVNQAVSAYTKLASLVPTSDQPYLRLAEIHLGAKNKDTARDSLTRGLRTHPKSIAIQRALIIMDIADNRFSEALSTARQIQRDRPKESAGYVLEGDVHVAKKSPAEAASAYKRGMQEAPSTDLAERAYSALLLNKSTSEATALADTWLKTYPNDNTFRLFLAESANKRGEFSRAVDQYRVILAKAPNNPAILNNLAWSLNEMGDARALDHAERANKLAPNRPEILDTLGMILVKTGKPDRGVEIMAKAHELAPGSGEIRMNYARALIKTGKKADAKKVLEPLATAGEKFPGHAEVKKIMSEL